MSVEAERLVSMSPLYLAVDLGTEPSTVAYERQLRWINVLWWYCANLAAEPYGLTSRRQPLDNVYTISMPPADATRGDAVHGVSLVIAQTRLASPWTSVLTVIAEKSAPVGYGIAAIWSLQRLLHMIMEWQQHRLNIDLSKRYPQLRIGPPGANMVAQHAMQEFDQQEVDHGPVPYNKIEVDGPTVPEAVAGFGPIMEVKMIDDDQSGGSTVR